MPSKIFSATVNGLDAQIIETEVDVSYGLRCFDIVGLPDKSVQESKERVSSAIKNSGFNSPHKQAQRILVSLAPADLKKEGSLYDLPIALGYLCASKQIKIYSEEKIIIGELALDGKLRPVKGVISLVLAAKEKGWKEIILPQGNAKEASLVSNIEEKEPLSNKVKIIGVESLKQAIRYLEGREKIHSFETNFANISEKRDNSIDFSWIKGQANAKRAMEVTAAGGHHLMMQGPPGTGKSLLAKALSSILPNLSFRESLEVTKIYSIAGLLSQDKPFINYRPFRSPHHTSSSSALIGGGNPVRAGEITLAHRGILFMDEFPEFHRDVLESLREPLENGVITILRAKESLTFPARFTLVAAANPCPCGYYGNPIKACTCTTSQIAKYRRKLSGPLIDRIDIFANVPQVEFEKLISPNEENSSLAIKNRVEKAREIQKQRFITTKNLVNAEMDIPQIKKYCEIDANSKNTLKHFIDTGELSARGYHRILKTARTIADLNGLENISFDNLTEALSYRTKET
ncbi:MAG: YifB family Mg chelatase-like AAA ATPase [Patescibacteria group bacterium]|nr:YifB family Mg chelatase-like AAA ATPase [Patescibacteria group bacterium]